MKKKLINIMLQYYYNIKIMLIVYSLDQYVFFIMEYLAYKKQTKTFWLPGC